ncbi:hypothetical protein HMSSN036_53120 [Paenibacillus macerans]|nr:hypothetical protein HMSSN036_53120 [Paenibacillus macerans]
MKSEKISDAVVRRLPVYLRFLNELSRREVPTVSSQELGQKLDLNPAQIRKDLAYFGDFGRKGIGYDVAYLIEKIQQILNLDQQINVALVGAGNLGQALSNYNAYLKDNMKSWRCSTPLRPRSARNQQHHDPADRRADGNGA